MIYVLSYRVQYMACSKYLNIIYFFEVKSDMRMVQITWLMACLVDVLTHLLLLLDLLILLVFCRSFGSPSNYNILRILFLLRNMCSIFLCILLFCMCSILLVLIAFLSALSFLPWLLCILGNKSLKGTFSL